jgi:cytochrome b6-f complex iron-sulfur subunit
MSPELLAVLIVAGLFGLFALLLLASLVRARRAAATFRAAAAGALPERREDGPPQVRPAPRPVSRREFFRQSLLASVGLFTAEFGLASIAFVWPNLRGGFGAQIDLGLTAQSIKEQIQADRQPFYYGAGRFYLTEYDGENAEDYGAAEGLVALYQKCVHLGCRVPFCEQSQWFECPCHGSKYNRAGEYRDGPAPRGLDRFPVTVEDGIVKVDTSQKLEGPPRGEATVQTNPEGPFCVTIGGE